jgi:hypothetical protein
MPTNLVAVDHFFAGRECLVDPSVHPTFFFSFNHRSRILCIENVLARHLLQNKCFFFFERDFTATASNYNIIILDISMIFWLLKVLTWNLVEKKSFMSWGLNYACSSFTKSSRYLTTEINDRNGTELISILSFKYIYICFLDFISLNLNLTPSVIFKINLKKKKNFNFVLEF